MRSDKWRVIGLAGMVLASAATAGAAADAPLVEAAKHLDSAAVRQLLVDGAPVNTRGGDGDKSLHWAAQRNDPETGPGFPLLCLIASGGHTDLIKMEGHGRFTLVGRTRDDAALVERPLRFQDAPRDVLDLMLRVARLHDLWRGPWPMHLLQPLDRQLGIHCLHFGRDRRDKSFGVLRQRAEQCALACRELKEPVEIDFAHLAKTFCPDSLRRSQKCLSMNGVSVLFEQSLEILE